MATTSSQTSAPQGSVAAPPAGANAMNFSGASPLPAGAGASPEGAVSVFPFFTPSFDLALAAAVVALVLFITHTALIFKTKAKFFNLAPQAALMMTVGLALRVAMVVLLDTKANLTPLLTVASITLQAPGTLIAISIIFSYTRFIWWVTPREYRNASTLWIPPMYNSFIIAGAQTLSEILAMLGQGMIIKPIIPRMVSAGAVLEMLIWLFLAVLIFRFTLISRHWPMDRALRKKSHEFGLALTVQGLLLAYRGVYQVLAKDALVALQTTFKPISIVSTEEWPFYVFDVLPALAILAIQVVWHPGHYLPARLMGFSLGRKRLLEEENARLGDQRGSSTASNGWVISAPSPVDPDKVTGMESKYREIMEADRKRYEPKYADRQYIAYAE